MSVAPVTMEAIDIAALKPGAILPTPIYDAYNPALLLLGAGTQLSNQALTRLRKRGITRVIIDSEHLNSVALGIPVPKTLPEKPAKKITAEDIRKNGDQPLNRWIQTPKLTPPTAEQSKRFEQQRTTQQTELQATLAEVGMGNFNNTSKLKSLSVDSCELMLEDKDLFVKLAIDRQSVSENNMHSLRTAHLAMAIAAVLGKSCDNISDLGMGCLIARLGQTAYVKELLNLPRKLTDNEWMEVKKSPARTFDMMERCPDVPVGARQVAYQMFERWDGSGYPRGRAGTQIHPLSRIASVADTYVALTSGRPHRPPFSQYRAVEMILHDTRNGIFEPQAVRGLLQTVCLYPVGSRVRLSDESMATVLRTKTDAYDRPIIQITHDSNGRSIDPKTIDLADNKELSIVDIMDN